MKEALLQAALGFGLPLLLTAMLTALLIRWAPRWGLVDVPDPRKVHQHPTPHAGGLAIYAGVLVASLCLLPLVACVLSFLLLAGVLVLLGLLDDLRPLPWLPRLTIQVLVAAVVVFRWPCDFGVPARLVALLWIVGLINAFNMLDNMDLLSGGTAWLAAGAFALAAWHRHGERPALPFLILLGSLTGFLYFNRPPARIFMGDAGSTFLGFFLGVHSLENGLVTETPSPTWAVPLCVLAVPLYDLATVVAIRLSQGRSPFHPDKQHLSHRLAARGLGQVGAVRVIHLLALASGLAGLGFYLVNDAGALALGAAVVAGWAALGALEYVTLPRSV